MAKLQLEIVTPDRIVLSTEADYVSLPGTEGEFGVLPGHIPYFAALGTGWMHYDLEDHKEHVCVIGGFVEVVNNKVEVLVDSAELPDEIDVSRAEAALKRAQDLLEKAKKDDTVNIVRAEAALQRALTRLQAAKLT